MVLKRKRNLKIDSTAVYSVFLLKDLDPDELEDYVENRDTGMEADEEKEIHLQNIMKGSESSIPLPVIVEVHNPARGFFITGGINKGDVVDNKSEVIENKSEVIENREDGLNKSSTDIIGIDQGTRDCKNEYIEDHKTKGMVAAIPEILTSTIGSSTVNNTTTNITMDTLGSISTELLARAGNCKAFLAGKCEAVAQFFLRRVLLRYDRPGFEPYVCFRDRVFHPTFKSRRNETLMIEKLNRLGVEFATLKTLCQLSRRKDCEELLLVKRTVKIVKLANYGLQTSEKTIDKKLILREEKGGLRKPPALTRKQRKSISKMLSEGLVRNAQCRPRLNIHAVMADREKIQNLKSFKTASELFLDIKYYDTAMSLVKCKKNKRPGIE